MIETLLIPSCRAAVLICGLFLLRWCLGNRISPTLRHAFWALVPFALLPMAISSPVSVYNLLHFVNEPQVERYSAQLAGATVHRENPEVPLRYTSGSLGVVDEVVLPQTEPQSLDCAIVSAQSKDCGSVGILPIIYLTGCLAMLIIFLRQILLCRRWLAAATPVTNEEVLTLFETCRRQMKVNTWLVVSESPAVSGPFLIGMIRPTLLLPQGMVASATAEQLRTVFRHELAHLKRWDVWICWLATLLLMVHWFNPLLWLAIRKMNGDREEACDALALQTLDASDRRAYAHSLLDIVERFSVSRREPATVSPGLVGISETGKLLHRRIDMINQNRSWKLRWQILALVAVMFIGAATLTDAQERRPVVEIQAEIAERRQAIAEMRVDIGKLETELLEAKVAEGIEIDEDDRIVVAYSVSSENFRAANLTLHFLVADASNTMRIVAESDRNRFVVVGSKADHDKVQEMLAELEKAQNSVIPAQAGIPTDDVNPVYLAPRLRGGDGTDAAGATDEGTATVRARTLADEARFAALQRQRDYKRRFASGQVTRDQFDALADELTQAAQIAQRERVKRTDRFQQASILYHQQQFDDAKPLLEEFVVRYPKDNDLQFVLYYLGDIAKRNNAPLEAEFYFRQANRMFPDGEKSAEVKLGLAWAKEQIGTQTEEANAQ